MRAAQLVAYNHPLEIVELPDPTPGKADVVVEVVSCGICRSDWHVWSGDWRWRMTLDLPHILGHEIVGRIVAAGSGVKRFREGDVVIVPFHLSCMRCEFCASGRSNICSNYQAIGFHLPGGFADRVRVPSADANLVDAPKAGADLVSLAGCRLATAFHAVLDVGAISRDESVLVIGGGGLGTAVGEVLARVGARFEVFDLRADHGTIEAIEMIADRTIDCVVAKLKNAGRYVQLGLTGAAEEGKIMLPVDDMTKREIRYLGAVGCPTATLAVMVEALNEDTPRSADVAYVGYDGLSETLELMTDYRAPLTVFRPDVN